MGLDQRRQVANGPRDPGPVAVKVALPYLHLVLQRSMNSSPLRLTEGMSASRIFVRSRFASAIR